MKQKLLSLIALMSLTNSIYAYNETYFNPWTIEGSFGMSFYPNTTSNDNQTAIGRLSIGHALIIKPYWQTDIEVGIQSGTTLRLNFPKESIDVLGGVPIEAEIKPLLDVLIGVKTEPLGYIPLIAWLKGGMVYRQLRTDRIEVNSLNEFTPEIQLGLGYRINEQTMFNIGYQTIWGKNPELTVDSNNEIGLLRYIPRQQAILMGITIQYF